MCAYDIYPPKLACSQGQKTGDSNIPKENKTHRVKTQYSPFKQNNPHNTGLVFCIIIMNSGKITRTREIFIVKNKMFLHTGN